MLWFIFSFLTAIFQSLKDVVGKKNLVDLDEYVVSFAYSLFAFISLFIVLLFTEIPKINELFWICLIINGVLSTFALIFYMRAIKKSEISLVVPMTAFTPLFLLVTSPFILGEFPSTYGVIGIVLIVLGSYMLHIKERNHGLLGPIKALINEEGTKLMLIVAFIWSITSTFDKIGVVNSSPVFWLVANYGLMTLLVLPITLYKSKIENLRLIKTHAKQLFLMGFFGALVSIFQMIAITLTLVTYVVSIKRTNAVISVLFGHFVFKENHIKERLIGVIIMVIGVIIIALFN